MITNGPEPYRKLYNKYIIILYIIKIIKIRKKTYQTNI